MTDVNILFAHLVRFAQGRHTSNEFRRCWFSPILNQFTVTDPFTSSMKASQEPSYLRSFVPQRSLDSDRIPESQPLYSMIA